MNNIQYLSQYLEFLDVEKGLSQNTVDAYRRDLSAFLNFCITKGKETLDDISRNDINSYILTLRENKFNPVSIVRKIASPPPKDTLTLKKNRVFTDETEKATQAKDK